MLNIKKYNNFKNTNLKLYQIFIFKFIDFFYKTCLNNMFIIDSIK